MSTSFTIASTTAASGTIVAGSLHVSARGGDDGATIPFSILHGLKPGPVLALVAGIHAMEYAPILALQRLRSTINPQQLAGTVVMVHIANVPMFLGRTIYYSPGDRKNLNRVFPGNADGSISERIAEVITREVVARATHLVDLHGGDGNEWLRPYSYWITTGDPSVVQASRALALAFGLDHIVVDRDRPTDANASMYLSNTAITRGKPAITTECGCLGQTDDASVTLIERGVAGVMKHLGMRPDGPDPAAQPRWIERSHVLRASATGILHAAVRPDEHVPEGALIARVTDYHGASLEDIRAPFAGEILYIVSTPPISAGEPVAMVAVTR